MSLLKVFETAIEIYSDLKAYFDPPPLPPKPKLEVTDIRLINGNTMIIIPPKDFSQIIHYHWPHINIYYLERQAQNSIIHFCYRFNNVPYRIALSQSNNDHPHKLSNPDTLQQFQDGFTQDIESISSTPETPSKHPDFETILNQYAGPLGDFYTGSPLHLQLDGQAILDTDMTHRLLTPKAQIQIEDMLGNQIQITRHN